MLKKSLKIMLGLGLLLAVTLSLLVTFDLPRPQVVAKYANQASVFKTLPSGAVAHIRDQGQRDRPVILLIHGSNASLHTWEPWVQQLGDSFRLISIDLPGHGLTGATPEADYGVDAMSRFVKQIVDALDLGQVTLAGNSMGGSVSLKFALDYPQHTKALILVSSSGMSRKADEQSVGAFKLVGTDAGRLAMRYITPRFLVGWTLRGSVRDPDTFITDAMVDRYWELLLMEGSRQASSQRFANYANRQALEPRLPSLDVPALLLWGEHDRLIPPDAGQRMAQAIANSQLITYPQAGHLAHEELPAQTAADVRGFMRRVVR